MKAAKPQNRFTGSIYTTRKINERNVIMVATNVIMAIMATTLDNHSGLEFTSGGVDYLGLELLEHKNGVGTIWHKTDGATAVITWDAIPSHEDSSVPIFCIPVDARVRRYDYVWLRRYDRKWRSYS